MKKFKITYLDCEGNESECKVNADTETEAHDIIGKRGFFVAKCFECKEDGSPLLEEPQWNDRLHNVIMMPIYFALLPICWFDWVVRYVLGVKR